MLAYRPAVAILAVAGLLSVGGCGGGEGAKAGGPAATAALPDYGDPLAIGNAARRRPPQVVEPEAGGPGVPAQSDEPAPAEAVRVPRGAELDPGLPPDDDSQLRRELRDGGLQEGARAGLTADGQAIAPIGAPAAVLALIAAGNQIADAPYRYGGGHSTWVDTAYDCSGSISFTLAAAGVLNGPLNSTGLAAWGLRGPGRWVTIYANGGHAFMTVAGLRFDTSGAASSGSRWQAAPRSTAGFAAVHPPGL